MRNIGLLNDTFPPIVDGVANAVVNYAKEISKGYGNPFVVVPEIPNSDDSKFDFPVIRYPSLDFTKELNVVAGLPFAPKEAKQIRDANLDVLHCHCPVSSLFLARAMRNVIDAPIIMTYHTKFDIDIKNVFKLKHVSNNLISLMIHEINAVDEVWVVSKGAGENLKSLGYEGDCVLMENGVDVPHSRVSDSEIKRVTGAFDLPSGVPVFIFAGRMMWYKGIKIIVDALSGLLSSGRDFRMVFVGGGTEFEEIKQYIKESGILQKTIFTGRLDNRDDLRAWYCRADLLLFPSTFDTNGLVVREAAACSLPTVLVEGSCAAEGITDGRNGYLIAENAVSLALKLDRICEDMAAIHKVGENAGNEIYISWESSVKKAMERYEVVIDNYRSGKYPKGKRIQETFYKSIGELMSFDIIDRISF